jgi:hypothetical protein
MTVASDSRARGTSRPGDLGSIVREAIHQFVEVNGTKPEQVSGVRSTDEGWSILVEVLDLERVPSTTSVLSTYRVDVDSDGQLLGFERVRRYVRSSTDSS